MADITVSRRPTFLGAEFNAFLFASIGADASGSYLTVVSALARLDLDPWAEAATLARLPGAIAAQKLAELISRFPEIPAVRADSSMIATRLTALLPGRIRSKIEPRQISVQNLHPVALALTVPRFILSLLWITIAILFGAQIVIAQFHPTQTQSSTQSAASAAAPARIPPSGGADIEKTGN
jgi:hypothetical protein